MNACGCPCGMCAVGMCHKCYHRPHVAMTCTVPGCGRPGLHVLLAPDGVQSRCGYCLIQLLADVERVGTRLVLSVEPVMAVA